MFIITGGSRGIGAALAKTLASRKQAVLIIGRNQKALESIASTSSYINLVCADVATSTGRDAIISYLDLNHITGIQGLIHNAGSIEPIQPMSGLDEKDWRAIMSINLDAPFFLTQKLLDKLKSGRVLHISSGAAHFPVAGWAPYCVSKAGLSMLTRCWQTECPDIASASVMPGIVDTAMQAIIRESEHIASEKHQFFHDLKNNNQLVSQETVAAFLTWLLLDINPERYASHEWDIYDASHHAEWLPKGDQAPRLPR
ncbi:MAG: SDR family NAD(P)-dependent oxidoreductase [Legionellaceae bacterium]|nr:SDR family NAD(P)-dependent oxidoreductase [Legionellaceae bacterium]